MTDTAPLPAARRIETLESLTPPAVDAVNRLIGRAAEEDGQPAVSEQGRLHLHGGARRGVRHLLVRLGDELVGYGQLEDTDPIEIPAAELVVMPGHRCQGHGRALARALLELSGNRLRLWAHGGHPAARHLAATLGLTLFRELRQMRRPLPGDPLPEPVLPPDVTVRAFRPGEDDTAWLAVNAAAFAHHPEQGSLTQRDLDDRKAQPWFDPAGFFLAVRGGDAAHGGQDGIRPTDTGEERIVGFHWTKVHPQEQLGEVYVLGVDPDEQGSGLGRALTVIGLRYLAGRGLPAAMLYVDADNTAAVRVYERLGFHVQETDVMFRTET